MDVEPKDRSPTRRKWNHHPDLPITHAPIFALPFRPRAAFVALMKRWVTLSGVTLSLVCALAFYAYLLPEPETTRTLSFDWIALMWVSNLVAFGAFAGGLHLYLYTFRAQGERLRFDARKLATNNGAFTFRNQVIDNAFWSLTGGVGAWTFFQVLYFWATSNGFVPMIASFSDAPVLIVVTLILLPLWRSAHFYWIHRLLHWPPLYRTVHHLHHRNTNIGPWSGISMHPVENLIFVSSVLIHFVIPTHPVVVLLHLYSQAFGPALSHAGFEKVLAGNRSLAEAGHFHHQLHHRYFECNYGTPEMPWDEWFGSFHDGTDEATARVVKRRQQRFAEQTAKT